MFTFKMPDIGEGVVEGEVVAWLKKEGDTVSKDEPVVVMMTDKATVELPTPYAGILTKIYYKVGEIAKKDLPLFDVEISGEVAPLPNKRRQEQSGPVRSPSLLAQKTTPAPSLTRPSSGKALAAPPVRKMARDLGISLQGIAGTGPGGRITREDLQKTRQVGSHSTPITHLPGDTESPLIGIKNLMAQKMSESHAAIPSFSYFDQADATRLVQLREKMKGEALQKSIKLTYLPFFIRALSMTLLKYPLANSSLDAEKNTLIEHSAHNIGIAMASELGLIVPVLKAVEKMDLFKIILAYEELKQKAKASKLASSDMKEATVTITNFGALGSGGVFATPIINYPEVAILGLARIHPQPAAFHNHLALRETLNCSWSFDHRVIDGELAAEISHYFVGLIENPAQIM